MQQPVLPAPRAWLAMGRSARLRAICLIGMLLFAFWPPVIGQSVDSYGNLLEQQFQTPPNPDQKKQNPEQFTATQWKIVDLENALKAQTQRMAEHEGSEVPSASLPELDGNDYLVAFCFIVVAVVVFRHFVAVLDERVRAMADSSVLAAKLYDKINADEEALTKFVSTLQGGSAEKVVLGLSEAVAAVLDKVVPLIEDLRFRLQRIEGAMDIPLRQQMLEELRAELYAIKGEAGMSELLPAWQMATALEALTKQLVEDEESVTPSALRAVGGGLAMLERLCAPGIRGDLLINPPFRLLAVDDDLITRQAVSGSLKKALNKPDLACEGEGALALVAQKTYDVIFLDVQMPGMDGFELCTKIHETPLNATTPVVFVTGQSDFAARARSVESGGHDLIGKPFLSFEIAVKALTLAIPGRLRTEDGVNNEATAATAKKSKPTASADALFPANRQARSSERNGHDTDDQQQSRAMAEIQTTADSAAIEAPTSDPLRAFQLKMTSELRELHEISQSVLQCTKEDAKLALLTDLCFRLQKLIPADENLKGHAASRVMLALEGLLKKLLESPKNCTTSALVTAADALDLLIELAVPGIKADMATNPPIRIMVVDDDPVARRAIGFALHLKFEKPESMENGESAVALATSAPFDVIFMDVQMPGLDGITACSRIRESGCNRTTPIVFVTAHGDITTRTRTKYSGGNDLVGKPILTAEINLKALAFALRGRLQIIKVERHVNSLPAESHNGSSTYDRRRRPRSEKQARRR